MDRIAIKHLVIKLRKEGKTYSEIVKSINLIIPKSTLANWCRGIEMPSSYWKRLDKINAYNYIRAREAAWAANKNKREILVNELYQKNYLILDNIKDKYVLKSLLAMLYLGEGAKWKSHRGLMLGSSEVEIVNLYIKLLNKCYGINLKSLKCRVSYRADQDLSSLEHFWSKSTGIPLSNFYKSKPDPRTVGKATLNKQYKGVCVVTCAGTHIQLELETIPKIILMGL